MKLDTVREDKAIQNLTSRLTETFAGIHSPQDVDAAVAAAREAFADDRVRDYVPILVERMVRAELTPEPDQAGEEAPDTLTARTTIVLEAASAAGSSGGSGGTTPADSGSPWYRSRTKVALPATVAGVLVVATIATVLVVRNGDDVQAQTNSPGA